MDVPAGLQDVSYLEAGAEHICAISAGVVCWGKNDFNQSKVPSGMPGTSLIATGWTHSCALTEDGVKCWGLNNFGQADVPLVLGNVSQIVAGRNFTPVL